jgi:hypothetical protein
MLSLLLNEMASLDYLVRGIGLCAFLIAGISIWPALKQSETPNNVGTFRVIYALLFFLFGLFCFNV